MEIGEGDWLVSSVRLEEPNVTPSTLSTKTARNMSSLLVPVHRNHLRGFPEFPYENVQMDQKVGRLRQ